PLPSVTAATWLCPFVSVYVTVIFVPGLYARTIGSSPLLEVTVLPSTAVITSPGRSPAASAGPPGTTPTTAAPPEPDPKGDDGASATWTPRKAVPPTCTVADDFPETISFEIVSAFAIGIA